MSILHNERAILREVYTDLDESLEYLNSELNKEAVARSNMLHRLFQETGSLQAVEDALAKPAQEAISHPAIRQQMTILLGNLYDLVDIIREVKHATESVRELTQNHLIQYNTEQPTREGAQRSPELDRNRPVPDQDYRTRPGTLASNLPPPHTTLGHDDPGNLQQDEDFTGPHADGQRPRRKRGTQRQ